MAGATDGASRGAAGMLGRMLVHESRPEDFVMLSVELLLASRDSTNSRMLIFAGRVTMQSSHE